MSAALPVLYERNVRSALPHVTVAQRGCLLICVGRSETVRARVEEALAARLEPGKTLVRGSLAARRTDLWRALVQARDGSGARPEDTALSFRLGGDHTDDKERFFGLNVGREMRAVERLRLLLWVDGFEQLEALRSEAPDLWAVRTDVQFYVSREDFEVPEGSALRDVNGFDDKLRQVDEDLKRGGLGVRERRRLLAIKARLVFEQGRYDEALRLSDELERKQVRNKAKGESPDPSTRAQALDVRCRVFARLGRFSEIRQLDTEALREAERTGDPWMGAYASGRLAHTLVTAEAYGAAFATYRDQLRHYEQLSKSGKRVLLGTAPIFANLAQMWIELGELARAEADADEANREFSSLDESESWRLFERSVGECRRASVARLRGRPIDELRHVHRSYSVLRKIQAWDRLDRVLHDVAEAYRRTGLFDDARNIAKRAMSRVHHAGAPFLQAAWLAWLSDLARDTGDLHEAQRGYEVAAKTLRTASSDTARAALAAIEEARIHANGWADALPPDAAAAHREEAVRLLLDVLGRPVSQDRHMEAHLALGRVYRILGHFDESAAALTIYRDWARAEQGPTRAARASLELASTSLARGDATAGLLHITAARDDLDREEPPYRSRFVQKEVLVALHDAHVAHGDLTSARAALAEALVIVRADGLRLEELDLLQRLAGLPPADSAEDHRLASAHAAAAIAREVLWPAEEARALATLASLELPAGHPEAARAALEEATWLADAVGPASLRDRLRALSSQLAPARPASAPPA